MKTVMITILAILLSYASSYGWNTYHYEHGLHFLELNEYAHAQNEFDYYLTAPSEHQHIGVSHLGRGLMFKQMGKYDLAISEFKEAIANDNADDVKVSDMAYLNMGAIYFKEKFYPEAVHAYSKAVESSPQSGSAHYWLGMSYLRNGEIGKAEKESEEAKKLGVPFTALSDELKKSKQKQ